MVRGKAISRSKIHEQLWDARNRKDCVKIHQAEYAAYVGISSPHMSRIMGELQEQGRVKKIAARKGNIGIYLIKDPADFPETNGRPPGLTPA